MPCNTVQKVSVELGKMNVDLLVDALSRLSLAPHVEGSRVIFNGNEYDSATGKLTLRRGMFAGSTEEAFTAKVKREYSTSIVLSQAKRYGWQVKEVSSHKWEVIRR